MKTLLKDKVSQQDINVALYEEIVKLDSRINWSIGIQITVAVATIVTMFSIAGYTISLLSKVL